MSAYYPPGVTDADIDRQFGGGRDDWPYGLICEHEDAIESLAAEREVDSADVHDFDGKPTYFKDDEVEDLSSFSESWGATCTWTCPVCHQENHEEFDKSDFYDE